MPVPVSVPIPPLSLDADQRGELQAVLDAVGVGIFALDDRGRMTFINLAACETLGVTSAGVLGAEPGFAPGMSWSPHSGDTRFRMAQGGEVEVEYSVRPMPTGGFVVSFQEVGERNRVAQAQTEALASTVRGLEQSPSLDAYLGEVLKALVAQLGESSGALWLCNEETGQLRLHLDYYEGELKRGREAGHPVAVQSPPGGPAAHEMLQAPRIYDVETSPELEPSREFHRRRGNKAILVLPMRLAGETVGTFSVRSRRGNAFSQNEINLAEALAHQATLALQLTRLAEQARSAAVIQERAATLAEANLALQAEVEERRQAEEALRRSDAVLHHTLTILAKEPPLDTFLGHVLAAVTEQLSGPASTLWFYHAEENEFRIHMSFGDGRVRPGALEAGEMRGPTRLPGDREDLLELRRTRRPVVVNDVTRHPHLEPHLAWLQSRGVQGLLLVPLVVAEDVIGVIGVHNTDRRFWTDEETRLAEALAGHASLAVQLTRYAEQARRAGVIEERNRLAQEIHDTLAQGFTGILVQLEAAQDALEEQPGEARDHVVVAGELARESLAEARRSVHALRPLALETEDLSGALARMVRRLADLSGVEVTFECRGSRRALPEETADNLLRGSQEALANALRHAEASEIRVRLEYEALVVRLSVRDNGHGFEPEQALAAGDGLGLRGLRDRAARMGGQLTLRSEAGAGSEVTMVAPLQALENR